MKVKESKTPLPGEAFTPAAPWYSLNWSEIEAAVNALQIRIARAAAQKSRRNVHRLSYLLTKGYEMRKRNTLHRYFEQMTPEMAEVA